MEHRGGQLYLREATGAPHTTGEDAARGPAQEFPALPRGVLFASDAESAQALADSGSEHFRHSAEDGQYSILWHSRRGIRALHVGADNRTIAEENFLLGRFALRVAAGTPVAQDNDGYVLEARADTLAFVDRQGGGVEPVSQPVRISLTGTQPAGQFQAAATLNGSVASSSIRYFYPSADGPVASFVYPLFEQAADVAVVAHFDPAHPQAEAAGHLVFAEAAHFPAKFLTVDGTPLQLQTVPNSSGVSPKWDPVVRETYWTPRGAWTVAGPTAGFGATAGVNLMCGLSGLEFAKVQPAATLNFFPDSPAYAPSFLHPGEGKGNLQPFTETCPDSEFPVQTAWVYVAPALSDSSAGYYSQPVRSGLFHAGGATAGFLETLQVMSAAFPQEAAPVSGDLPPSFPMAPYAGIHPSTAEQAALFNQFETEMLSTARCNLIFALNGDDQAPVAAGPVGFENGSLGGAKFGSRDGVAAKGLAALAPPTAPSGPAAVTPQGLLSTFSQDHKEWLRLVLATTGNQRQTIEIRNLNAQLRAAMLTSQMFLVISNVEAFAKACDIFFPGLDISGWTFDLTPEDWRNNTVLILKFAEKSLKELVDDLSLWSAAGRSFNNGLATQTLLKAWIKEAEDNRGQPEFDYFLETVLGNWNGVLFANVRVPPSDFPPQLQALAAGINLNELKAHHLGVNLSPFRVQFTSITVEDSSLFGLIYYNDETDLVYSSVPYDFKVLSLRVLFANSEIASFSSRIELLVAQLFGERSKLKDSLHGDNIILLGVMQKHGGEESYTFTEQGTNIFQMESLVLQELRITQSQFVTLPQKAGSSLTTARFLLAGTMRFLQNPTFDLLSFGPVDGNADGPGGLQFSNLFISMDYGTTGASGGTGGTGATGSTGGTAQEIREFSFQSGQMNFDPSRSVARPDSLYARFPLQVTAMVQGGGGTTPASLGFMGVQTELASKTFGGTWFGLQMALSLGSQGGLASKSGFYANLLAAWSPDPREYNALLAIQMPGSDGNKTLTIEGPLKLSIQDISMLYNAKDKGYLMRFANIALSLFGLKFPPGGTTNLLLFGDPDPKTVNTTLGWYAAYEKNPSKTGPTGQTGPGIPPRNPARGLLVDETEDICCGGGL